MVVAAAAEHQYAREAGAGNLSWSRNCPSKNASGPFTPDSPTIEVTTQAGIDDKQDLFGQSALDQWQVMATFEVNLEKRNTTITDHLSKLIPLARQVTSLVEEKTSLISPIIHSILPERVEKFDFTYLFETGHDRHPNVGAGAVFQDMVGMLLGQNLPRRLSYASSSRVLVAAWLVFVLIFGVAYRGNLTAFLTLPKYPPRPETLKEIVDSVDM
ncbi:hypothetical protein O3P69_004499 [Scylla paramamosain]|uniref:Ionotropic glutamate receptor C-terminal domain-containing protein n=1 Tax=Scylla paramamosain TaxID=85552 RepID=A0AAW0UEM8_SCYPA